ncbi:MAG: hypothetical protein QOI41_3895 [Myxococcales bacterium]|nr:hypothetical protein [Myxococcales bacterium]
MATSRRGIGSVLVGFTALLALAPVGCSPAPPPPSQAPLLPPVEVPVAAAPQRTPASVPVAARPEGEAAPSSAPSAMESALKEVTRKSQCEDFDYYPNGGIQSFWCHRPARITLAAIRELAGDDVFTKGPNTADDLKLDAASDFGRYNPAFVRFLIDKAGPSERGSAAQKATQPSYEAHLKPLAEIFWKTYAKSQADKECFAREKAAYGDLITRKKLPKDYYERWFYFMNPYFCDRGPQKPFNFYSDNAFDAGVDGNVTKTVIGFWLRRSLDGTMDAFAEGLKKLLASYEPELLAAPPKLADAAALTRAIDAAVRSVAACKDPKSKAATAAVAIMVSAEGQLSGRLLAAKAQATPTQSTCIEQKISSQTVPPFDGESLMFNRTIALK